MTSGDVGEDAWPVRYFVKKGHLPFVAQSFSKDMGLYGERIGTLSIVCQNTLECKLVESQLKIIIRPLYSIPPIYGARLVRMVLSDPGLRSLWLKEAKMMADRLASMRRALRFELEALGSTLSWRHLTEEVGMFCYAELTALQCDRFATEFHI